MLTTSCGSYFVLPFLFLDFLVTWSLEFLMHDVLQWIFNNISCTAVRSILAQAFPRGESVVGSTATAVFLVRPINTRDATCKKREQIQNDEQRF